LRVGSRVRIKQPRMPVLVLQVDEIRDQESFTWTAASPGVRPAGPGPAGTPDTAGPTPAAATAPETAAASQNAGGPTGQDRR
jgi:hypothetical protein